jgi:2'-5' RNA ligase
MSGHPPDLGAPCDRSAVIIRAHLPAQLERWRRRAVADAADGLPAHATMLYPFVAPERLDGTVRRLLAEVAARHAPIEHRLVGPEEWRDVTYAAVDPVGPFVALQRDLQAAFPAFPIYGPDFVLEFVPHVTVDEGAGIVPLDDRGWRSLPEAGVARAIEVIVRAPDGRWRTVWRIGLGDRRRRAGPR